MRERAVGAVGVRARQRAFAAEEGVDRGEASQREFGGALVVDVVVVVVVGAVGGVAGAVRGECELGRYP